MAVLENPPVRPGVADQSQVRTTFPAAEAHDDHDDQHGEHAFAWPEAARIAFVALAAAAVWFRVWEPLASVSVIGVLGVIVGGWPIFKEAAENIVARRMTMELSMSIAIVAAAAIGEFFTVLVITLFVLVAEVLEGMTVSRGRRAIHDLLDFLPRSVSVRRGDTVRDVDTDDLKVGDAGLVNAGSINQSGAIEIRAERIGRDTSYGKIIEAVERAERSRAPVQRLADRMAGYLVYFALGAAALTFLITRDVRSTISVVIVAGACGIAAGTPLAILGAIGRAARLGAIIKGGLYLESLGRVRTVVFDKTGTLTLGEPRVTRVLTLPGFGERDVLQAAAIAEKRSEHPSAKAI